MEVKLRAGDYRDKFLSSVNKFPSIIAGVGSGKTLLMLVKIYKYCEEYPGTTALVVRKEFTDLHDSTINDFQNYFNVKVGSDKNYTLPDGSKIMFRHASEIAVLKNINLGIAGIEQAEEFEDDKQFQFIRDRLRQENGAKVRPLVVIANANGHNWIYNLWIKNSHREEINAETGQFHYTNGKYECLTANTFANAKNLPQDFLDDCTAKEIEAPNHYRQYVLNDHEVTEKDDFVFTFQELEAARKLEYALREGYGLRLSGFDIARYGADKCAAVSIQQMGALRWKVNYVDEWEKRDLAYTTGRIVNTVAELHPDGQIIDADGYGAGNLDHINAKISEPEDKYKAFHNATYKYAENKQYGNPRTRAAFELKDLILKGHISLTDEDVCQELLTLRFTYMTDGRKILISKEKMRKEGIKSPNKADALLMAVSLIGKVRQKQQRQYKKVGQPQYSKEENLFQSANVR